MTKLVDLLSESFSERKVNKREVVEGVKNFNSIGESNNKKLYHLIFLL